MDDSRSALILTLSAVVAFGLSGCGSADTDTAPGLKGASDSETSTPSPEPADSGLPYTLDKNTRSAIVKAKRFGESWPLTVKSGIVNCVKEASGNVAVIFQPSSSTADNPVRYALNGYAKGSATMKFYDLQDIDPIWADNPKIPGTKKDIGVLIDVCTPYMP
jgi:hypothetical protein